MHHPFAIVIACLQATKTCSTPMITPKFDTSRSLNRTISRTAKAGEVLVSLSGSPVAPVVSGRSQAAQVCDCFIRLS